MVCSIAKRDNAESPILVPSVCTEGKTQGENEGSERAKAIQLNLEVAAWIDRLAPWTVVEHLTFPWSASVPSATRCYEKFHRKFAPDISYFFAVERNPSRCGSHLHALLAAPPNLYRKRLWQLWFDRYRDPATGEGARARIEPVRSQADVTSYVTKYCTKDVFTHDGWWNFHVAAQQQLVEGASR